MKVILIAGLGRSGSTLLGALLGQLEGAFFGGELFKAGLLVPAPDRCGCGLPLDECPVWREISARCDDLAHAQLTGPDGTLRGLVRTRVSPEVFQRPRAAYADLFRAIGSATGCRVVVDSSKQPGYADFLRRVDGVDLRVVHLVRDPRAGAHSRLRAAERIGQPPPLSIARLAITWNVWNLALEALWRHGPYLRLRYEDFASDPAGVLERVAAFAGIHNAGARFTAPDVVELAPTHSVAGNRSRFLTGEVKIRLDDEWRSAPRLSSRDRRTIDAVTWSLRRRYGYG